MGICEGRNASLEDRKLTGDKSSFYFVLIYFVLIWSDLFYLLQKEWHFNLQYSYAYLVPFFAYLIFQKRIEEQKISFVLHRGIYLSLIPLCFLPVFHICERAHPEWRLLFWGHTVLVFLSTCLFLLFSGSKKNLITFFFPFFFLLSSVPWPYSVENNLKGSLVQSTTWFLVEILNALGIIAESFGSLIHIENGLVGIDEACSGVQSLQAGIMLTLFLGAYLSMSLLRRGVLFVSGIFLTFIFNLMRTTALSLMTYYGGASTAEKWHDTTGMIASICVFLCIALFAFYIQKESNTPKHGKFSLKTTCSLRVFCLLALLIILTSRLLSYFYYVKESDHSALWRVNLLESKLPPNSEIHSISDTVKAQLRFDTGREYSWSLSDNRIHCQYLYFAWESRQISSFAGIHNPNICLPAGGFTFKKKGDDLQLSFDEVDLSVEVLHFTFSNSPVYVFYAIWDESMDTLELDLDFDDRIESVFKKSLPSKRFSIEFILYGAVSEGSARAYAERLLYTSLELEKLETI